MMEDISKIQMNLRKKIKRAKKSTLDEDVVQEAERVSKLRKKLQDTFKKSIASEMSGLEAKEKQYEPITAALERVETAVTKVHEGIESTDEDIKNVLALVPKKSQLPVLKSPAKIINIGPIAKHFLSQIKDPTFGIRYDDVSKSHKIGKKDITFEYDDIIMDNKKFKGTKGLWLLLTSDKDVDKDSYDENDYRAYVRLLQESDSIYQNNDKNTNKPKSSVGLKYNNLIKPIYASMKKHGSGLLQYNENPIEYKYINNLSELIKRLQYISAQEQAGNNNFYNEKIAVIRFFTNELENIIDSPKGIEYLIKYVSNLPKRVVKGSGIVNDLINNLPFELHWPGYNYLGPGTKLDERLSRKDQPINKLDEAAREHDIYYKHNKDTKSRHKADEILENKAWDRVLDKNAELSEKIPAWVTTNLMKTKRYLGMGLK